MTLQMKIDETRNILFDLDVFEEETSEFVLKSASGEYGEIEVKISYPLKVDNSYNKDEYEVYLFFNNNFAENDIFQVYEHGNDSRIGWVFPVQALLSNNHNHANNVHFLPYAHVAFEKLLRAEVINLVENPPLFRLESQYSLNDFYNSDQVIVMILCTRLTGVIENFDICSYIPFLYSKGYYWSPGDYKRPLEKYSGTKRLNIKSISQSVKNEDFITQLFKEFLMYEKHHLVKFYLLYQVIELLIEKVFNKELTGILRDLSSQSKTLFQIKEELGEIAREKERIKKLFLTYTSTDGSKSTLMTLCNSLLENVSRDPKLNAAEALYSVRNLFVHEYRSVPSKEIPLIETINNIFEDVIIEILCEVNNIS